MLVSRYPWLENNRNAASTISFLLVFIARASKSNQTLTFRSTIDYFA
jgi:hypothetical protein